MTSRLENSRLRIATLGPQGTYSERASRHFVKRLGMEPDRVEFFFTTVLNSLRMVQNRQADYAVIPAENMIDGLIGSTFDALIEFQDFVKVCDEIHLPINHILAAPSNVKWDGIARIYSHPSALNQCQNRLADLFPGVELIAVASTAAAAELAAKDTTATSAAICCNDTAQINRLAVYETDIQDYTVNETRFIVCGLTDAEPTGNDRTLLAVRYGANQPGQLYQTAKYFAEAAIDLAFVQSRPYKVKPQEYVLIYELIGHKSDPRVEQALKNVELQVRASNGWKKILGSYPKRERETIDDHT